MAGDTRIAARYAKSVLELGIERNQLDQLYEDMLAIREALSMRDFLLFVKSPIIKADKKQAAFHEIFGDKLSEVITKFFDILSRKGREFYLPEIVDSFIYQYKEYNNITEVKLTTANKVSEDSLEAIRKALADSSNANQTVEIQTEVNPELIGGFVIEFGDKLYDASVARKLDQIRKNFQDYK
jgi:F-type H+-transporting ATPase subunit delta